MDPQPDNELPRLTGNPLLDDRGRIGPIGLEDPRCQRLVRRYAYGVPTDETLDAIAEVSPAGVVELGAGTGYWARLLHERGVDVVAYDRWPPPSSDNRFVDDAIPWFPVLSGDERDVARHADRTLLLVWPTRNEVWPADALTRFHAAGGSTVVFVGEGPGGRTGDSVMHALLGAYGACLACGLGVLDVPCVCHIQPLWRLVRLVAIPQWDDADDSCLVYERATVKKQRRTAASGDVHKPRRPRRSPWRALSLSIRMVLSPPVPYRLARGIANGGRHMPS